jgi:exopolyphosphatase/guanosine-5'-triphosphate,3'-diphosphate pyrophosphatase
VAQAPWFDGVAEPLAGIGGSVRNLAAAAQRLHELPNGGVQGFVLTAEMLSAVVEELAARDVEGRRRLPGINPDRGDVILAAAVVLESILAEAGFDGLEITEAGLREGLFFERYLADRDPPVHADVGRASVANLLGRHSVDPAHAARVCRHALALYDGLAEQEVIAAADGDRRLLEAAALLHDIGRSVGFDNRHKHARYLILDEGLPGYDREATATIAQIVRYMPKGTPEDDARVELLAGVLRVTERLERTRSHDVDGLELATDGDSVVVRVRARSGSSVGVWAAAHSTALLSGALGRPVTVERSGD